MEIAPIEYMGSTREFTIAKEEILLNVQRTKTHRLCIDDIHVTKDQIQAMLFGAMPRTH